MVEPVSRGGGVSGHRGVVRLGDALTGPLLLTR